MVTCNHHLDDRLSLSHVSRRRRRPGVFAVNDIHWWIDGHALEGNFYDANHRRYVEDKLSKNILTPYLETPKDIVTKRREALSGSQICRRANFHADRWHLRRDICPGTHAKIHTIQQMIYTTKRMLALRLSYKKLLLPALLKWQVAISLLTYSVWKTVGCFRLIDCFSALPPAARSPP